MSEKVELFEISGALVLTSPAAKEYCRKLFDSGLLLEHLSAMVEDKANNTLSAEVNSLTNELQTFRIALMAGQLTGAQPNINSGAPALPSGEVTLPKTPTFTKAISKSGETGNSMLDRMRKMKNKK